MIIRLGPKYSLRLDPTKLKIRPGWQAGIFDICDRLLQLILPLFILLTFSFDLFAGSAGSGTILAVYALVISALVLQLVKRVLGKEEYLPQVSYDLILLTLTTTAAVSLFYHTAVAKDQLNLWGGLSLRAISAISLIAYWCLYYLLLCNTRNKKSLGRLLKIFFWAPILMAVAALVTFREVPATVSTVLICLIPGFIILLLTQKKNLKLLFLDLILAFTLLFTGNNNTAVFAVLVTFIISFLTILIKQRNKILLMFRSLDKITKQELRRDPLAVVNRHALLIFFLFSLILSLYSLFWFSRNLSSEFFNGITLGFQTLKFNGIIPLLIGNGMVDSAGGKFWQLIFSYGLIPVLLLALFLFRCTRDVIKLVRSKLSLPVTGLILSAVASLAAGTVLLLLQNNGSELVIFILVFLTAVLVQLKQIYLDKLEYRYGRELNLLSNIKDVRTGFLLRLLQIIIALLLIAGAIYLLSSLNYINIFLTE